MNQTNVLEWIGITNRGSNVCDDQWVTKSGIVLLDGYCAKRCIKDKENNKTHSVTLTIIKSAQGKPLFEARITKDTEGCHTLTATNPTTTFREVLKYLGVSINGRLNGYRFFGLLSKDYQNQVNSIDLDKADENVDENQLVDNEIPILSSSVRSSGWVGVINYGFPINNPQYIKTFNYIKCRLQPGY